MPLHRIARPTCSNEVVKNRMEQRQETFLEYPIGSDVAKHPQILLSNVSEETDPTSNSTRLLH